MKKQMVVSQVGMYQKMGWRRMKDGPHQGGLYFYFNRNYFSLTIYGRSRPRERRKRLRSLTPSERWNTDDDDELRSPLSKRKKIAADRSGSSKLKEMLIAETDGDEEDESQTRDSQPGTPRRNSVEDDGEGYDMDEASSDGEMYDEDDFLARELEEDMG